MKKSDGYANLLAADAIKKILIRMKLAAIIVLGFVLQSSATVTYSQRRISLDLKKVSIQRVLKIIENRSEYRFVYGDDVFQSKDLINIYSENATIDYVMERLLAGTEMSYKKLNETLVIVIGKEKVQTVLIPISGRVTDELGVPLSGVSVVEKGTTNGAVSDDQGRFSIEASGENVVLEISRVGYETKEVNTSTNTEINITLSPLKGSLEEVVVVGYGTQRRENITGAISFISTDEMSKRQVSNTSIALQGLIPGVSIIQRGGGPMDAAGIRVRGYTSLGNVTPLILVDGIEMGIDNIDPSLIESISVLKDASSASIYGNRAAAGVVLITTKRGVSEKINVSYQGYFGQQSIITYPKNVNAIEHMELLSEAQTNVGITPTFGKEFISDYKANINTNSDKYPNTDWYKELMKSSAPIQNHIISIRGGSQKVRLMGVVGYLDQKGIVSNVDKKRYFVRLNSDFQATDRLKFKMDAHISQTQYEEPTSTVSNAFHWAMRIPANKAAVLSNGKWGEGWNGENPVAFTRDGGLAKTLDPSVTLTLGLEYKIAAGLLAKFSYSPNYWQSYNSSMVIPVKSYYADNSLAYTVPQQSSLWNTFNKNRINQLNASLNANKHFGSHTITGLLGFQQEDFRNDGFNGGRNNFAYPQFPVLSGGSTSDQQTYGWASDWALRSFFGRINYDYKGKYLLEGNLRYDGSSRFAKGHKWGLFPSFSAGWKISQEDFWNVRNIQLLKLRASYGKLGNQLIGNYPFASVVALWPSYSFYEKPVNGAAITTLPNKEITWESTAVSNIGLDMTFLKRLNLVVDVYKKLTTDILLPLKVPLVIGMAEPMQNAGVVSNKGWEASLSYSVDEGVFKYNVGFNLSNVVNKIVDIKGISSDGLLVNNEGYSMNSLLLYEAVGYISEKDYDANGKYLHAKQFGNFGIGDIRYKDQNGDNAITAEDKIIVGNTIPGYTYGFFGNMSYKGLDFSMLWQGVGRANGYLYGQSIMPFVEGGTLQEQHKDRWTPANTNAKFPRLAFNEVNNMQNSTFWVKDASFLKLRNVQLGYTIPSYATKKLSISSVRFFVSGENLLSFNNFWKGFDPEAPVSNGAFYPHIRTTSVGLNVNF